MNSSGNQAGSVISNKTNWWIIESNCWIIQESPITYAAKILVFNVFINHSHQYTINFNYIYIQSVCVIYVRNIYLIYS